MVVETVTVIAAAVAIAAATVTAVERRIGRFGK